MDSPYPPVRRLVTGHTSEGKAIHIRDEKFKTNTGKDGQLSAVNLYLAQEHPANNNEPFQDPREGIKASANFPNLLRVVDFPPSNNAFMHRTESLDYGIVIKGQIVHILDSGEEMVMEPGDIMVQRGSNHSWENRTKEWTRMYFILNDAKPVEVNGQRLGNFGCDPEHFIST